MKHVTTPVLAGLMAIGTVVGWPHLAFAQGGVLDCSDPTLTNPVFMAGTTAVIPVIRLMGARLRQINVTLLWNENSEGCASVNNLVSPQSTGQRTVFSYYQEVADQPGKVVTYTCNAKIDQPVDLVINDVAYTSCSYGNTVSGVPVPLPSGFGEFQGPVQGVVPIVQNSFSYDDITCEELQDLYICGAQGKILSFTTNATIFDYNSSSGMRELWARSMGLPNAKALSTQIGLGASSAIPAGSMVQYVITSGEPDSTIGYTSTEYYDQSRDVAQGLKVRGLGQKLAYRPDSDKSSTDKLNIREGRYTFQGALKLVAAVDGNGVPTRLGAKHMIDWFQGNLVQDPALQLPFEVNEIFALRGVVPQCAMKVTKDADAPVFKHYRHPQPCGCSFEVLATGKTSVPGCVACVDASTCQPGQICSHGYCEQVE